MGARAQVKIIDNNADPAVYLYAHWSADELVGIVQRALAKKWRWDDSEYLARIIFCEMVKDDINGETNFGIGTSEHGDIEYLITVDCAKQQIIVDRSMYGGKKNEPVSFDNFII